MNIKKINCYLSAISVLLLLFLPLNLKVKASSTSSSLELFYKTAIRVLSEKFYLKEKVDYKKWENKFLKIKSAEDTYTVLQELISNLGDPYTRLLTKEEYKEEKEFINSKLVGIGIKLAIKNPKIVEVVPNGPAQRAGIKPNDYLLTVNAMSTYGLSSNEVCNLLKGEKDSFVTLGIKRDSKLLISKVKREELNLTAVTGELIEKNIGLIKIDTFISNNTSALFKAKLETLMPTGGLIIDLRNNTGGLLNNAVQVADYLLSEGKIVTTVKNNQKINEYANANKIFHGDIIILVNENTASASEILAAALKENNRAKIIGTRTYGKGLVQEIIELPDKSAMHVTVAEFLTPKGKVINKIGIKPDKIIDNEKDQIEFAKQMLIASGENKDYLLALLGLKK